MTLPTREDISPTSGLDLDERVALDHFLGKTFSEASVLFFEKPDYYANDLMWMGKKAFVFYFPSLEQYITSKESAGDSDIINTVLGTLKTRLDDDPVSIKECQAAVMRILVFARDNLGKFKMDPRISGDVAGDLSDLIQRIKALGSADA